MRLDMSSNVVEGCQLPNFALPLTRKSGRGPRISAYTRVYMVLTLTNSRPTTPAARRPGLAPVNLVASLSTCRMFQVFVFTVKSCLDPRSGFATCPGRAAGI